MRYSKSKNSIAKVLITSILACIGFNALAEAVPSIIPRPAQLIMGDGEYQLPQKLNISAEPKFQNEANYLSELLSSHRIVKSTAAAVNSAVMISSSKDDLGAEGYRLQVTKTGINIQATTPAGAFYGVQSLLQMLPPAVLSNTSKIKTLTLPFITIEDSPRFSWRSFMLDEARYFKGKQVVKKLLDQMAMHKMNVFHWHLTDDQGWRIEIKKYPRLTQVGAIRADTQIGGFKSKERAGEPHGGFYTQSDIKEIVAYAATRHITIVPEIGMPGHASAAVAAYPELGTAHNNIEVPIVFGKLLASYNAADEKVYQMLSDILDEVVALFPSQVIHIGGDEVRFEQWQASAEIKALMAREKLATMADVQIYFTNRISKIIADKGRSMMGWNEIIGDDLHGFLKNGQTGKAVSLSQNALVHFWKGSAELAENAIKKGHQVVNSWHSYTYLSYSHSKLSMAKVYHFDPVFSGLEPRYHSSVKGLGCQIWGEWIPTAERMYQQVFPRFSACAEVAWTALKRKNFTNFEQRMKTQFQRWQVQAIPYNQSTEEKLTAKDFFNQPQVASWSQDKLSTTFNTLSWDVSEHIKAKGNYKLAMLHLAGKNALEIQQVALFKNGKRVAKDRHYGLSGESLSAVVYQLKLNEYDASANYQLKAQVKGSVGTDSTGEVKMWRVN